MCPVLSVRLESQIEHNDTVSTASKSGVVKREAQDALEGVSRIDRASALEKLLLWFASQHVQNSRFERTPARPAALGMRTS